MDWNHVFNRIGWLWFVYVFWGGMMNFIKRIRWMNLLLWLGLMTISFTIWYYYN